MSSKDSLSPGTVVAGKYRIDRVLGEGAMGKVVAATHLDLDRQVALKFMLTGTGIDEEMITRFLREARAAGRLTSEHVVRIFDVGRDGGTPFIVMELLNGEDVGDHLARFGRIEPISAADIVRQACEGISEAHQAGIIHRDIKPQNLFVAKVGGRQVVKVLDFGISKIVHDGADRAAATLTKVPLGTPLYMAPEQLRSAKKVDARADVWALGTTLYELISGDPPFIASTLGEIYLMIAQDDPPSLRSRVPGLPIGLENIVLKCLAKNPDARFHDAGGLRDALTTFLGMQTAAPISPTLVGRPLPSRRLESGDHPQVANAVSSTGEPSFGGLMALSPQSSASYGQSVGQGAPGSGFDESSSQDRRFGPEFSSMTGDPASSAPTQVREFHRGGTQPSQAYAADVMRTSPSAPMMGGLDPSFAASPFGDSPRPRPEPAALNTLTSSTSRAVPIARPKGGPWIAIAGAVAACGIGAGGAFYYVGQSSQTPAKPLTSTTVVAEAPNTAAPSSSNPLVSPVPRESSTAAASASLPVVSSAAPSSSPSVARPTNPQLGTQVGLSPHLQIPQSPPVAPPPPTNPLDRRKW